MDLGDNYPRGVHVHQFPTPGDTRKGRVVYGFKTRHGTTAASPDGTEYPKYDEISTADTTFYKWSNDNGVYTEIAQCVIHPSPASELNIRTQHPSLHLCPTSEPHIRTSGTSLCLSGISDAPVSHTQLRVRKVGACC
jgi:hypothetical protein